MGQHPRDRLMCRRVWGRAQQVMMLAAWRQKTMCERVQVRAWQTRTQVARAHLNAPGLQVRVAEGSVIESHAANAKQCTSRGEAPSPDA